MSTDRDDLPRVVMPEQVYVPVADLDPDAEPRLQARVLDGGEVAAIAYSTLDELVACAGEHQPWVLMPSRRLAALRPHLGFDRIVLDLQIPVSEWHDEATGGNDGRG